MNRIALVVVIAAAVVAGMFLLRGGEEHRQVASAEGPRPAVARPVIPSPDVVLAIKPGATRTVAKPMESRVSP
jgi:cell division septation protein DedD